jgi:hypothetical protein
MTDQPASMIEVYRRFLDGELPLAAAAHLLRQHAPSWTAEPGSLKLDTLSAVERKRADQLFSEAVQPILAPFLAGEIDGEAAARQLAPLVLPVGVFALNLRLPTGQGAAEAMARFAELAEQLAELEKPPDHRR